MSSRWHEDYERGRPGYSPSAVRVLDAPGSASVLELGAGTGKLTRLLLRDHADVLAIEPDPDMRRWLAAVCPEAIVVAGTAEAIPRVDQSVDAVFSAEAFHWFAHDRAPRALLGRRPHTVEDVEQACSSSGSRVRQRPAGPALPQLTSPRRSPARRALPPRTDPDTRPEETRRNSRWSGLRCAPDRRDLVRPSAAHHRRSVALRGRTAGRSSSLNRAAQPAIRVRASRGDKQELFASAISPASVTLSCVRVRRGASCSGVECSHCGGGGRAGSGKSTLAAALADSLQLPLLSLDQIKEALADVLGLGDERWSNRVGDAAAEMVFRLAKSFPGAVAEGWWRRDRRVRAVEEFQGCIEVFCRCDPAIAQQRATARLRQQRHPIHRDVINPTIVEALTATVAEVEPLRLGGQIIEVDTTYTYDLDELVARVSVAMGRSA